MSRDFLDVSTIMRPFGSQALTQIISGVGAFFHQSYTRSGMSYQRIIAHCLNALGIVKKKQQIVMPIIECKNGLTATSLLF